MSSERPVEGTEMPPESTQPAPAERAGSSTADSAKPANAAFGDRAVPQPVGDQSAAAAAGAAAGADSVASGVAGADGGPLQDRDGAGASGGPEPPSAAPESGREGPGSTAQGTAEPAFPGRRSASKLPSAAAAAASAAGNLDRARAARKRGDDDAAIEAALSAYDAAAPFAASDERCRAACEQANRIVTEIGRRSPRAAGPTRFE